MLKQYKLRNYHFQLVIYIAILNIIGILIIGSAKHSVQKMQIAGFVLGLIIPFYSGLRLCIIWEL